MQIEVRLTLSPDRAQTTIAADQIPLGVRGELTQLLIAYGGTPDPQGFRISTLGLRRCAVDLAAIFRKAGIAVRYDASVERVLRLHLEEIRARREAQGDQGLLDAEQVRSLVRTSGRFTRNLTEPQTRDLGRLMRLFHGANFSVPGAGKTTSLLAIYEASRSAGRVTHLLVVAPKNAFFSWETEIGKCYRPEARPSTVRLTGGRAGVAEALGGNPEIAIITYQLLPNVLDLIQPWVRTGRTHIVLDESHRIKGGPGGLIARTVLQLSDLAARRDLLTGTPLPHAPEDLRPQLEFLWPGQRILPEIRVQADAASHLLDEVQMAVRPLYTRTTKQELNLPPLELIPVVIELGPLQRNLYDLLRSEARRVASGMPVRDRRFFRSLGRHVLRLLQAATNPMLLTHGELTDEEPRQPPPAGMQAWELLREFSRYERPSKVIAAVERTRDVLNSDSTSKMLIWTSFLLNIDALERLLHEFNPVTLSGSVQTGPSDDPETREGRIRQFHEDPTCRVMIANPAAGGEAISLHEACHNAIYLDRTFNAAHYLQSLDRIHRLGLPSGTITRVIVIEARGTIDQRVSLRLRVKLDAMSHILADPSLRALAYDPEDVLEEFPAGLEPEDVEEVVDHLFERERREEDV